VVPIQRHNIFDPVEEMHNGTIVYKERGERNFSCVDLYCIYFEMGVGWVMVPEELMYSDEWNLSDSLGVLACQNPLIPSNDNHQLADAS
jgi:hypothetical protein